MFYLSSFLYFIWAINYLSCIIVSAWIGRTAGVESGMLLGEEFALE
jgi:hypothetical protein